MLIKQLTKPRSFWRENRGKICLEAIDSDYQSNVGKHETYVHYNNSCSVLIIGRVLRCLICVCMCVY